MDIKKALAEAIKDTVKQFGVDEMKAIEGHYFEALDVSLHHNDGVKENYRIVIVKEG